MLLYRHCKREMNLSERSKFFHQDYVTENKALCFPSLNAISTPCQFQSYIQQNRHMKYDHTLKKLYHSLYASTARCISIISSLCPFLIASNRERCNSSNGLIKQIVHERNMCGKSIRFVEFLLRFVQLTITMQMILPILPIWTTHWNEKDANKGFVFVRK